MSVNKYKLLICASTNAIYTFDTYIIISYIGKEDSTYDVKRSSYRKNRYCDSSRRRGSPKTAFSGYGNHSHGRCDNGEICTYG